MKKPWLLMLLALAVAAVSVFLIVLLWFEYMMTGLRSTVETAMIVSLLVIAIAMCIAFVMAWRPGRGWMIYLAALAAMLVAGIAPTAIDSRLDAIATAQKNEEQRAFEAKWLSTFENYKKDVVARIAAQAPFSPKQAQDFLEFVQGSNLRYRSLPDHSAKAFAVLKQALDAKIVDPNARVRGKTRIDVNEEPLFVVYYNFYLKTGVSMKRVHEHEWRLFQMLIAAGADLGDPAAAPLREVVGRETEPYELKGYLKFK